MKRSLCICAALLLFATATLSAQMAPAQQTPKPPPASPAATASGTVGGKSISIAYSSPGVKGRAGQLFGPGGRISKDPHYPVWRGGANAATTIKTDGDLKFGDLLVPAGTYTLFVDISDPDNWVLIVSKKTGEWGLAYDNTQDLGRTKMHMSTPPALVENLTYTITALGGGNGSLTLAWENHSASVAISTP
jgi:hypothetical protein